MTKVFVLLATLFATFAAILRLCRPYIGHNTTDSVLIALAIGYLLSVALFSLAYKTH